MSRAVSSTQKTVAASRKGGAGKSGHKFIIDISQPVGDKILDAADFERYFREKCKVDRTGASKPGVLGDKVKIVREGDARLVVTSTVPFSKRYLRYLCTKQLKKAGTRDFLRITATDKNTYALRYLNKNMDDEDE